MPGVAAIAARASLVLGEGIQASRIASSPVGDFRAGDSGRSGKGDAFRGELPLGSNFPFCCGACELSLGIFSKYFFTWFGVKMVGGGCPVAGDGEYERGGPPSSLFEMDALWAGVPMVTS